MIKYYRKRPVIIEAVQFTRRNWDEILKFTNNQACNFSITNGKAQCIIPTLEGNHIVKEFDYIIKGVHGEFYPCKPDIFKETYEEVTE